MPTFSLSTLGGSPVPCAAGLATLDVIERERLVDNAARMGSGCSTACESSSARSRLIGDVRGLGLIVGVELVADRETREPAPRDAHRLVYRLFELGRAHDLLPASTGNVIELTPPLTIGRGRGRRGARRPSSGRSRDVEAGQFDDAKLAPFAGW